MTANAKRNRLEETATKTTEKVSIPFTRSTSPPFIMNGLPLRWSCEASEAHNGFNELHLRSDAYERKFTNSNVTKIVDLK